MKDVPHHMMKFMRKVSKPEEQGPETYQEKKAFRKPSSKTQEKKQKKARMKKERDTRTVDFETEAERNKEMKKRVPIIQLRAHKQVSKLR